MKTYYRLQLLDRECWISADEQFDTAEAASEFRDEVIADASHWAFDFIVELGCPTRIVKMTEEVVREFPGLSAEDGA